MYVVRVVVGWLLEFYILATFKVISGRVATCESARYDSFMMLSHWIGWLVVGVLCPSNIYGDTPV